jgi:hypothetical protein
MTFEVLGPVSASREASFGFGEDGRAAGPGASVVLVEIVEIVDQDEYPFDDSWDRGPAASGVAAGAMPSWPFVVR